MKTDRPSFFKFARDIAICLLVLAVLTGITYTRTAQAKPPFPLIANLGPNLTLVVTDEACVLKSAWFALWKRGYWTEDGKRVEACWRVTSDGAIVTVDEAGDPGRVPIQQFQKMTTS